MEIAAIQHFSLLDYPGKISAIIFTQGCPFRCAYCHNSEFQPVLTGRIPFNEVLAFLQTRVGLLEGVVFSGGEPLMQQDLYDAMVRVKNLGFDIGLHTSGASPSQLKKVLSVVDWVGFDMKTTFENYETITKVPNSGTFAEKSFYTLLQYRDTVNFEIRTTVDSRYISFNDLMQIANFLKENDVDEWILQQCILRHEAQEDVYLPLPSDAEIDALKKVIDVKIRT